MATSAETWLAKIETHGLLIEDDLVDRLFMSDKFSFVRLVVSSTCTGLVHLLAGWMVVIAGSSYFAYTTVGVDFEAETPACVEMVYYRLQWDDGAT